MTRPTTSLSLPDELSQRALAYVMDRRVIRVSYREFMVQHKGKSRAYIVRRQQGRLTCTCKTNKAHDHVCVHIRALELAVSLDQVNSLPVPPAAPPEPQTFEVDQGVECPHCGARSYRRDGTRQVKDGRKNQRYECKACRKKFCNDLGFGRRWYSPELIEEALDLRMGGMSVKEVADYLKRRGKPRPSPVTIYRWQRRYGKLAADYLEQNTPPIRNSWMADETTVYINGQEHWTWNFLAPQPRFAFASPISRTKNALDARYAILTAKKIAGGAPRYLVTDGNPVYADVSKKHLWRQKQPTTHVVSTPIPGLRKQHGEGKDRNVTLAQNEIERYNGTQRERTDRARGFKNLESAREYLRMFRASYNMLRPHLALGGKTPAQAIGMRIPAIEGGATLRAILIEQYRREQANRCPAQKTSASQEGAMGG